MNDNIHTVYLSLGSNLGDTEGNLENAISHINKRAGTVISRSSFYITEPWGFESDNKFANCCIAIQTDLNPFALLTVTKEIEIELGRTSKSSGSYSDRIIDIDLLIYDDLKIETPELTLPHPLMYERDFVMQPLKEIYK